MECRSRSGARSRQEHQREVKKAAGTEGVGQDSERGNVKLCLVQGVCGIIWLWADLYVMAMTEPVCWLDQLS